jgi:hypothetical protein
MKKYSWLVGVEDYEPVIGIEAVERIIRKSPTPAGSSGGQHQLDFLRAGQKSQGEAGR